MGGGGGELGNGLLCKDTGGIVGCQAPGHPGPCDSKGGNTTHQIKK